MPMQFRVGHETIPLSQTEAFNDVRDLVDSLNTELGSEGFTFELSDTVTEGGFQRVYIGRSNDVTNPDMFLDLRVGGKGPGGRAIQMASSKPSTFGIPGFARFRPGRNTIDSTMSTFKDFMRSVYEVAADEQVSPQDVAWRIYQKGYAPRELPSAGAVLTPSSSTGQIGFTEKLVRYFVPNDTDKYAYQEEILKRLREQSITGLSGYGLEVNKWKAIVPMTRYVRGYTGQLQSGQGETVRGAKSEFKSVSTTMEARQLANVPLVMGPGGRYEEVPLSQPQFGGPRPYRTGWTRSSVVLPGESSTRNVLVQRVALADQPDLPGAGYQSPSAMQVNVGGERRRLAGMGEKLNASSELGISTMLQLQEILKSGGFEFRDIERKRIRGGQGRFEIGFMAGEKIDESAEDYKAALLEANQSPDKDRIRVGNNYYYVNRTGSKPTFRVAMPITSERRGYDIVPLARPTMNIPEYYNRITGEFSNLPGKDLLKTAESDIYRDMVSQYGNQVNFVPVGMRGSGRDGSIASVTMNTPIATHTAYSAKTTGLKAGPAPMGDILQMAVLGLANPIRADWLTQESKIPSRSLMAAFGIMQGKTQLSFLTRFLPQGNPGDKTGLDAVRKWLRNQYKQQGDNVELNLESMADVYAQATGRTDVTPDTMFAGMFSRLLEVENSREAKRIWRKFGIALPTEQDLAGMTYSRSEMEALQNIVNENAGAEDLISWEAVPQKQVMDENGNPIQQRELFRMRFRTGGQEGSGIMKRFRSAILTMGMSFVPEYEFGSEYTGPKALMSLEENYPEAAREMGQLGPTQTEHGSVEGWQGPLSGRPKASTRGWFGLTTWMSFQHTLEKKPVIPQKSVVLNPELAVELSSIITQAKAEKSDEARIKKYIQALGGINKKAYGIDEGIDLASSYFLDQNTATLIPAAQSIQDVEEYEEGVAAGTTKAQITPSYFRLLEAALEAANTNQEFSYERVSRARKSFATMIHNPIQPDEGRGKEIYRSIYGANLPGMRGGRYMGMTGLELGEGYADDDYIRKMLASGGYKPEQMQSIMDYLNRGQDAYLPMLFQRYPDVSGEAVYMPMKLRSKKWLMDRGVKGVRNSQKGVFYISPSVNRFMVGDFDFDPASQLLLKVDDFNKQLGVNTGIWKASDEVQSEFDRHYKTYWDPQAVDKVLGRMFGMQNVRTGSKSLDAARKNLAEYTEAMLSGQASLPKRLGQVGFESLNTLLEKNSQVSGFKKGMGISYQRRTLTEDIAHTVLMDMNENQQEKDLHRSAYEAGAYPYQAYLDRLDSMIGGSTQLEELLNTITASIDVVGEGANQADALAYRVMYKITNQGRQMAPGDKDVWNRSVFWQQGNPYSAIGHMHRSLTDMPEEQMPDELLASLVADRGQGMAVYTALQGRQPDQSRRDILLDMYRQGKAGYYSPIFLSSIYKLVERTQRKHPEFIDNPNLKLPWITGEVLPVKDIMQTREYRLTNILDRLLISRKGVLDADEVNELQHLGGTRLAVHALGIWSAMQETSGGVRDLSGEESDLAKSIDQAREQVVTNALKSTPIVHASELGSLVTSYKGKEDWTPTKREYAVPGAYQVLFRWMGMPEMIGDRDYPGETFFKRQLYEHVPEISEGLEYLADPNAAPEIRASQAIAAGNRFEAAFAETAQARGLHHVGQVRSTDDTLRYRVNGVEITGVPDFVGFDPVSGKMRIVDTKLAAYDPSLPGAGAKSLARVKSYKYRVQQLAYAYGLEKLARSGTEEDWMDLMNRWHYSDTERPTLLRMRDAARMGQFSIELQPGHAENGLKAFAPIEIGWGDAERQEFEDVVGMAKENVLKPQRVVTVARSVLNALNQPLDKRMVPGALAGSFYRTNQYFNPKDFSFLNTLANLPVERLSHGARLDSERPRRIRVGEGGPEEIEISNGEIKVVGTQELRAQKGRSNPNKDYGMSRMATGDVEPLFPEELGGATAAPPPPVSSPPPAPIANQPNWDDIKETLRFQREQTEAISRTVGAVEALIRDFPEPVVKVGGGGAPPPSIEVATDAMKSLAAYGQLQKIGPQFEENVRTALKGAFQEAGVAIGAEGDQPSAANLMIRAATELQPHQWMPAMAPLMKQAKEVQQLTKASAGYLRLVARPESQRAQVLDALTGYGPGENELARQLQSDLSDPRSPLFDTLSQGYGAAKALGTMTQDPLLKMGKYGKGDASLIQDASKALKNFQDALVGATDQTTGYVKVSKEVTEANKDMEVILKRLTAQGSREKAESMLPAGAESMFIQEGPRVGRLRSDTFARMAAGELPPEAVYAGIQSEMMQEDAARAAEVRTQEKGQSRLGKAARHLLSGFGLFYLERIGREIVSGGMPGYVGGLELGTTTAQRYGGIVGGVPYPTSPENQIQMANAIYGGAGFGAMRQLQANWMQGSPATYQAARMGLSGLVGWGAAQYVLPELGVAAPLVGPLALATAGTVMTGIAGLNLYQASANQQQTSVNAATRLMRGENMQMNLPQGNWAARTLSQLGLIGSGLFDPTKSVYNAAQVSQNTYTKQKADLLNQMYQAEQAAARQGQPFSREQYLAQQGIGAGAVPQTLAEYARARAGIEGNIPFEASLAAIGVETRYGLTQSQYMTNRLAEALGQGAPVTEMAQAVAGMTGAGFGRTDQMTGQLIQQALSGQMSQAQLEQLRFGGQRGTQARGAFWSRPNQTMFGAIAEATQLAEMSDIGYQSYASALSNQQQRAIAGRAYYEPKAGQFAGTTQESYTKQMQNEIADQVVTQIWMSARQSLARLNMLNMGAVTNPGMTAAQVAQVGEQANFGFGLSQALLQGGAGNMFAQRFGQAMAKMSPTQYGLYSEMMNLNPMAWASYAQTRPSEWQNMMAQTPTVSGWGGTQIPTWYLAATDVREVNGQQVMTGMQWGTSSLGAPGISSAQMVPQIWGANYAQRPELSQGLISAMAQGGTYGGQLYQLQLQAAYQQQMAGINMAQQQLQMNYQPQFWALEDQMRDVSRGYQMWNLNQQSRQLETNNQFSMQNLALNRQQQLMGRRWTVQDWSYQDLTRNLQWGWQQEDFQEEARFMTGRQRRLAERQMGRATIMHELEGDQISKQRARQKELWKVEDERYKLQLAQQKSSYEYQKESIARTREYYKETWALQDKQTALSRQYWKEQQALQMEALKAQQAYAAEQQKINQTMAEFQHFSEQITGGRSLFNKETWEEIAVALAKVNGEIDRLLNQAGVSSSGQPTPGSATGTPSTGTGYAGGVGYRRAYGGTVLAGQSYTIGEQGIEEYIPMFTGTVVPNRKSDPWQQTFVTQTPTPQISQPTATIVVNIGNERLGRHVLKLVDSEVNY